MDARKPATRPENAPSHHPATLTNARGIIKTSGTYHSRYTIPSDQPLCRLYGHILDDTKQGNKCHETIPHLSPPSNQGPTDASVAIMRWIEGESDDDSLCEPSSERSLRHKPVDLSTIPSKVAEALYGPFTQSNDYANPTGPSAPNQEIAHDVEMEDSNNSFEDEVMIYYRAAIPSLGPNPVFDTTFSTPGSSHTPPPGSVKGKGYGRTIYNP